jgi:hypothetical protein
MRPPSAPPCSSYPTLLRWVGVLIRQSALISLPRVRAQRLIQVPCRRTGTASGRRIRQVVDPRTIAFLAGTAQWRRGVTKVQSFSPKGKDSTNKYKSLLLQARQWISFQQRGRKTCPGKKREMICMQGKVTLDFKRVPLSRTCRDTHIIEKIYCIDVYTPISLYIVLLILIH